MTPPAEITVSRGPWLGIPVDPRSTPCVLLPDRFYLDEACNLSVTCQAGTVGC